MTVYETDLPGVGRKFEIELEDGVRLVVVIHNTGRREVYRKSDPDADAEKLFDASNELSQTIGSILEGSKFQPVEVSHEGTMLGSGTLLEWFRVGPESPLIGRDVKDVMANEAVDVQIVAIQRDEDVISSPGPDTVLEPKDTLVVIGTQEAVLEFKSRISTDNSIGQ